MKIKHFQEKMILSEESLSNDANNKTNSYHVEI